MSQYDELLARLDRMAKQPSQTMAELHEKAAAEIRELEAELKIQDAANEILTRNNADSQAKLEAERKAREEWETSYKLGMETVNFWQDWKKRAEAAEQRLHEVEAALQKYVDHFGDPLKCARAALAPERTESAARQNTKPDGKASVPSALSADLLPGLERAWQPIETAPKSGYIMGAWKEGGKWYCRELFNEYDEWVCVASDLIYKPSHWMPLPSAEISRLKGSGS